jgi:hypothetical protein
MDRLESSHKNAHGCFMAVGGGKRPPRLAVLPQPCRPTTNVHMAASSWQAVWGDAHEPDLPDAFDVSVDGGLSLAGGADYNMWCLKLDDLPPFCRAGSCTSLAIRVTVTIVDAAAACVLLYLLVSIAVNAVVFRKRGWHLIPHADHIRSLAGLVTDGVLFSSTILRRTSQSTALVTARPSLQSDGPTTVLLTQQGASSTSAASHGRRRMAGKSGWQASAGVTSA